MNCPAADGKAIAPELQRLFDEVAVNEQRERDLAEGLSPEQLAWRPASNRWSLADIFVHLRITIENCLPALDAAIDDARRRNLFTSGPMRMTRMGRFFVWYVEPPPKLRLPAPKILLPIPGDPREAVSCLVSAHRKVDERMMRANGLDLPRARFASPFAKFISMDLLASFSVYTAHERRHIFQAENVRKSIQP